MQEDYVVINAVPTHIFTWGKWINEDFGESNKELVLLITGSPGIPEFYSNFCSSLYEELDKEVPIWVIGHAGHDEANEDYKWTPSLNTNEGLYDLQGQINHKIKFFEKFVPKDVKIHLIGHSVGAKISTELLKIPEISERVEKCYLLCPTIEHMARSRYGLKVPMMDKIFFMIITLVTFFNILPNTLRSIIVKFWIKLNGWDADLFLRPFLQFLNPRVIERVWFMALDEMEKIKDLDIENIKKNKDRLKLYYVENDEWIRNESCSELIEKVPGIDAELCDRGFEHAFTFKSGIEFAKLISQWINQHKNKNQ